MKLTWLVIGAGRQRKADMSERHRQVRRALCAIAQEVFDYAYDHYSLPIEWNSGEVLIVSKPSLRKPFKPGRTTIVTSGAPEIAWLLNRVGQAFSGLSDDPSQNKSCDRLVRLIRVHEMSSAHPYRVNSILMSVIDEAFTMLDEMEQKERDQSRSTAEARAVGRQELESAGG
jgi:hypothetical protein